MFGDGLASAVQRWLSEKLNQVADGDLMGGDVEQLGAALLRASSATYHRTHFQDSSESQ